MNALLAVAVVCILAAAAWGLDTQDMVVEWTAQGKAGMQRGAEWRSKEKTVFVPAGPFLIGSDKKTDGNVR